MTANESVDFTDINGNVWGYSNGVLVAGTVTKQFGTITLTPKLYKNQTTTGTGSSATYSYDTPVSDNEAKAISNTDVVYNTSIVASDRARITWTDPTNSFTAAFSDLYQNTLSAKVKLVHATGKLQVASVIENAEGTYGDTETIYYSVNGDSTNDAETAGSASSEKEDAYATNHQYGKVTTNIL